jgi:nicotinate phosphoribosyltransferase
MYTEQNLTMLTDLYQLTMMQGYYKFHDHNKIAVFDIFYRTNPFDAAFSVVAGLDQLIDYIEDLHFGPEDIRYLRSLNLFEEDFLNYLSDFRFTGEIYALPEGTIAFPGEPLVRVKAPLIQAQLIETAMLCIINHQSLIATKAVRINWAAKGDPVMEFGLRRAQGPDAGTLGARAAVIGGCIGTSNVLCSQMFGLSPKGTHAHSWVMSFDDELTAFRAYAKMFPDMCLLLVDTYDTLKSGVPNAIRVFQEMRDAGISSKMYGIRLDSGDLAYLSKEARKMLDEAGFPDAIISASSDLDEYLVRDLKLQGAQISLWGIGTKLITAEDCPSFGGVYKMSAEGDENGQLIAKIKLSDNPSKITNPGYKKIVRIYEKTSGYLRAELIALNEETFDESQPLEIFDPQATWKRMTFQPGTYTLKEMLVPVFQNGQCVYARPTVTEIQQYCKEQLATVRPESRRLINAQTIPVDLSQKLYDMKESMIRQYGKR